MSFLPRRWVDGAVTGQRLHPIQYSLDLSEDPLSAANMLLPDEDDIAVLQFYELPTPTESAGIFVVASLSTDYSTGLRQAYFERAETLLGNSLVRGIDTAVDGTITEIVTELLESQQAPVRWAVGTIEATDSIYMDVGDQTILDCLTQLITHIPDYHLEFDCSQYPWLVHVRANPTTPTSEGRLHRNIVSCNISYSTTDMCTRVLNDKLTDGHADSPHINDYNRIFEQTIVLDDNATAAQRLAVANSYMHNRDTPAISVTITARDFYGVTGVEIDHFRLSQMFRLAMPEYSITENLRIIAISYSDVYGSPENVSLTLANRGQDLAIDIARSRRGYGGGGGGGGGYGKALEAAESDYKVRLETTETNIIAEVERISAEEYAAITVQSDRITALVQGRTNTTDTDINTYNSNIILMAQQIASKVSSTDFDNLEGRVTSAESSITQNANNIALKVSTTDYNGNEIASLINQNSTTIAISAARIDLQGYVTATQLAATTGRISTINAVNMNSSDTCSANVLYATSQLSVGTANSGSLYYRGNAIGRYALSLGNVMSGYFLGDAALDLAHYHTITATEGTGSDAGKIFITLSDAVATTDTTNHVANFNIAATNKYRTDVAAAAAAVTIDSVARLSGNTFSSNKKTVYFNVKADASNGATLTQQVSANVTDSYNQGADDVTVSSVTHVSHSTHPSTTDVTVTVTLSSGNSFNKSFTFYN